VACLISPWRIIRSTSEQLLGAKTPVCRRGKLIMGSSAFVSLGPAGDERFAATGDRHLIHIDLSVLYETEVCEATGHKNAQPTHP